MSSPYDYMEHPHIQCIGSHTLNSVSKEAAEYQASCEKVDKEVFLDFGFPIGSSVNGYRFVSPKNHMYSSEAVTKSCDIEECQDKPCYCTHIVGKAFQLTRQTWIFSCSDLQANPIFIFLFWGSNFLHNRIEGPEQHEKLEKLAMYFSKNNQVS